MQASAVLATGEKARMLINMTPGWLLQGCLDGEPEPLTLHLQAVTPHTGTGFVYLFSNVVAKHGVLQQAPPSVREVLFYAPVVGLLKCPEGFQVLSYEAWKDLVSETYFQDFGMPPSMLSSLNGNGDEEEAFSDDAELSLASDLDTNKDSDLEEAVDSEHLSDEEGSDDGSVMDAP